MPALEQRVLVDALRLGDLERRLDLRRQRLVLRKAEQPVEADGIALGDAAQRVGARQAERLAGEKLRQRRAVDADRLGEGGARQSGAVDNSLQPLAKDRPELALIHMTASCCVNEAYDDFTQPFRAKCNPNATDGAHSHIAVMRKIAVFSTTCECGDFRFAMWNGRRWRCSSAATRSGAWPSRSTGARPAVSSSSLVAPLVTLHSSLQHEALHGHPTRSAALNEALVFLPLGLLFPYRRFKTLHLRHHNDAALTDPYDDPETFYYAIADWREAAGAAPEGARLQQHLPRPLHDRPAGDARRLRRRATCSLIRAGDRAVLAPGSVISPGSRSCSAWPSASAASRSGSTSPAAYLGLSILNIRTFAEHQAHETPGGRTVIVEASPVFGLLFLNNNLHYVHHENPRVPWYALAGALPRQPRGVSRRERKLHVSRLRRGDPPLSLPRKDAGSASLSAPGLTALAGMSPVASLAHVRLAGGRMGARCSVGAVSGSA